MQEGAESQGDAALIGSHRFREIHEQPQMLDRLLQAERKTVQQLTTRLTVALATPGLFSIYRRPPRFGRALVTGISQSGESPDIVAVLAKARGQGVLTAAITNSPDSDLVEMPAHRTQWVLGLGWPDVQHLLAKLVQCDCAVELRQYLLDGLTSGLATRHFADKRVEAS